MNILLTAIHPVGGIRTYLRYVYSQDEFRDITFTLVGRDSTIEEYINEFLPKNRIKVIRVKDWKEFIYKTYELLHSKEYMCVHSHGFTSAVLTYFASFFQKVTHVITAHDVFTERQFFGYKGKLKKFFLKLAFNRADYIHTVTHDAQKNLKEYFPTVASNKLRLIVHGVDTEKFQNAKKRNLRKELNLQDDHFIIGFFGRFMGQKGFRVLVDAIKLIKISEDNSLNPIVLTFGNGGYVREDYQYLTEHGLAANFIQMPNTNDMGAAIKGVDVVAMPSRWEACGLLAMEVLSAGVPIVGTNCVGLREVLENTPALTIDVDDREMLEKSLTLLAESNAKSTFVSYQDTAVKRFSIISASQGMRDLYSEIE